MLKRLKEFQERNKSEAEGKKEEVDTKVKEIKATLPSLEKEYFDLEKTLQLLQRRADTYAEQAVKVRINSVRDPALQQVERRLEEERNRYEAQRQALEDRIRQQQQELQSLQSNQAELQSQISKATSQEQSELLQQQLENIGQQVLILDSNIQQEAVQRQNLEGQTRSNLRRFEEIETAIQQDSAQRQEELNRLQAQTEAEVQNVKSILDQLGPAVVEEKKARLGMQREFKQFRDERTAREEEIKAGLLSELDERTRPLTVAQQKLVESVNALSQARAKADESQLTLRDIRVNISQEPVSPNLRRVKTQIEANRPTIPPTRTLEDEIQQLRGGPSSAPPEDEIERMRQQAAKQPRIPAGVEGGGQFISPSVIGLTPDELQKLDEYGSYAPFSKVDALYLELSGNKGYKVQGTDRRTSKLPPSELKRRLVEIVKQRGELPAEVRAFSR